MTSTPVGTRGPVRVDERALGPDLARGGMLLFIALANSIGVVFAGELMFEHDAGPLVRAFNVVLFTFVHGHAYPVFAFMFGYGMVQLASRQRAAGVAWPAVRSILLRRNAWLVLFGAVHGVLLSYGDFLGAYGLVGIAVTLLLLRRGDRVHRLVVWLWGLSIAYLAVVAVVGLVDVLGSSGPSAELPSRRIDSLAATGYVDSVRDRLAEWPAHTLVVLPFIVMVWLGVFAARRRILEDPASHGRLLGVVAAGGLGLGALGGLPSALVSAGLLHVDEHAMASIYRIWAVSSMYAGPGYVALFGLIALRLTRVPPTGAARVVVDSVGALGKRSLSGYLFQSVAWLVLFAPYTFDLGARLGAPTAVAVIAACLVWLVSVVAAAAMERRGVRGPAEAVLRRLTYRKTGRPEVSAPATTIGP